MFSLLIRTINWDYVWATSWGVSTRLMGALIMTHSDDNGLVLPPHLAPIQVVIVPIYKNAEMLQKINEKVAGIVAKLKSMGISVKYDNADNKRPGFKFADYELKGVPVRLVRVVVIWRTIQWKLCVAIHWRKKLFLATASKNM